MNITYSHMRPCNSEKITLLFEGKKTSVNSDGRSGVIKIISGSAYVCGAGYRINEDSYILDEKDVLNFCGELKIMAKTASFEARVLYFDSI